MNTSQTLNKAIEAHRSGDFRKAEDLYREILGRRPDHFHALHYLGVLHCQAGNYDMAIELIQRALQINASDEHVYYNLGIALQGKGRADEAVTAYKESLRLAPGNADAFVNLGVIYREKERLDEALDCFRSALHLDPSIFAAHNNIGIILKQRGELDSAIESLRKALELRPNSPEILFSIGAALMEQGKTAEASETFEGVLSHRPDSFLARLGHCMAQIPVIHPDEASLHSSREKYREELIKLRDMIPTDDPRKIEEASRAIGTIQPFYLAYQGLNDRELQKIYGDTVCRVMGLRHPEFAERPAVSRLRDERPLRVGFVSGHFCNHSVWKIPTKGWIENLDSERFELFGYYTWTKKDEETAAARRTFKRFVEDVYSFEDLCNIIRKDDLHILIYPEVGMDPVTLKLAALRLAPVQCAAWGHPSTSGLPTMDYYLSSNLMEPPDGDKHYTEKLIRLPNLSVYYTPVDMIEADVNRDAFNLRSDSVVYHCCQSPYKYLPQYDEVFPRIAREVQNCRFLFGAHPTSAWITELFRGRIRRSFEQFDLNADEFVVFLSFLDIEKYNALYRLSDIFLDPIGWSGCNSALEAVSRNLPVVAFPRELMRSRDSSAVLTMMNVKETIAYSLDQYVELAVRLGRDTDFRRHVEKKISANKSLLYGDRTCIAALEDFCEKAVQERGG